MSRFTDDWFQEMIDESHSNRDKIIDWLTQFDFVKVHLEYEFVTLYFGKTELHLDFGIRSNSICCTYGNDDYEASKDFSDLEQVKEYILGLKSFQYEFREQKLERILSPK